MKEVYYCSFCGGLLNMAPELSIPKVEIVKKCITCNVGFYSGTLNFIVYDEIRVIKAAQEIGRVV